MRSKIAENTIYLAVSGVGGLVLTLTQLSILSRFLGADVFGLFVSLRGFSLLLSTMILIGLPQVLIRFFPSYQSRGKRGRANGLLLISICIVLILGYILYVSSPYWRSLMPAGIRTLLPTDRTIHWMILASLALAVKLLLYGSFNGLREMKMQMLCELCYLAALTAYIFIVRETLGVALLFRMIFFLNGAVSLIGLFVFFGLVRRLIPEETSPPSERIVLPSLLPYWLGSVFLSFIALAFTDVDRFVMSSILPVSAISLFHVASRINFVLRRFLGIPIIAAQPEITRIYEEGRWDAISGKITLFTKVTLVTSLFVTGIAAVVGKDAIVLLSGDQYSSSYHILLLLLPTVPIAAVIAPLLAAMRSLHYIKWAVLCDFVWMAVYFGTFFVFVAVMGVVGMAVAQVAASIIQMITSIAISKSEGFYGGVGTRLGRVFAVFVIAVPVGVLIVARWGIPASVVCLLLSPLGLHFLLKKLGVFDAFEKSQIVAMIPMNSGKRAIVWLLALES